MYPYSIFVVNHSRRHYLQFHHPLMRMFSSLQPSKRRHLKSSTRCHSPTSISWSRSRREAWISCPEMCTSVDTIRDRVLNNQAMNFAIFKMTGEDLEDTNDSLKGNDV